LKSVELVTIDPPPPELRARRDATFVADGEKKSRYHLPREIRSASPVGYRTRVSLTPEQATEALGLLSLERPSGFADARDVPEQELFEESALGVMSARQSTNYRGQRQVTFRAADSARVAGLLRQLEGLEAPILDGASMTHVVLCRPYRTAFTLLLTFIGHRPLISTLTVPLRAWRKKVHQADDIPTIGYLMDLHVGVLADAMERASVIASGGRRRAQVLLAPFCGELAKRNQAVLRQLEDAAGVSASDRRSGWRIALVAQVGEAIPGERPAISAETCRVLGANLLAFRSERIQPGVNAEESAPAAYQTRQGMSVPDALTVQCGRAAYNAFAHFTASDRERAKDLLLLERIDVLTDGGKERLRAIRRELGWITDRVVATLPKWADLPTGRLLSRSAAKGRKAFALAGQRIYVSGMAPDEIEAEGIDWQLAVRGVGAAAARSALVAEIVGVTGVPDGCDMLAGICLMAGPVNQNDVGKQFYGVPDLLATRFGDRKPTSLLIWTLKAKTVADPIGNEEQLLDAARKGALVDLRPGPHEVVDVIVDGRPTPMRSDGGRVNEQRAFDDVGNFVRAPDGTEIAGNAGRPWGAA